MHRAKHDPNKGKTSSTTKYGPFWGLLERPQNGPYWVIQNKISAHKGKEERKGKKKEKKGEREKREAFEWDIVY